MNLEFSGEMWFWKGPSPFHFITVPEEECGELEATSALVTYGWGMIPVRAHIGGTEWKTSLFPKEGRYISRSSNPSVGKERGGPPGAPRRREDLPYLTTGRKVPWNRSSWPTVTPLTSTVDVASHGDRVEFFQYPFTAGLAMCPTLGAVSGVVFTAVVRRRRLSRKRPLLLFAVLYGVGPLLHAAQPVLRRREGQNSGAPDRFLTVAYAI